MNWIKNFVRPKIRSILGDKLDVQVAAKGGGFIAVEKNHFVATGNGIARAEARAEQGGIHEAMMGAGNFVGPGIGALSLMIAPHTPHAGVWSVSGLLAIGLAVLLGNRLNRRF